MIVFSDQEGFIKSKGIKYKEGQEKIQLPPVAVGVFSKELFNDVIEKYNCLEVGYIKTANLDRKIYIINYKGEEITFFMAGVAAPIIAGDIEEISASGVKKFIIFGNCGVLDKSIEDCSIIIPNKAYREEGTSYHYVEASETIELNPKYKKEFKEILKEYDFDYREGPTWTTDAFYRETKEKIEYFKNKGVLTVEMEGSTIAAVCQRLKLDYFTFYYAGDSLDSVEWDERSLNGEVNIDKKKEVMLLALNLAHKIKNL